MTTLVAASKLPLWGQFGCGSSGDVRDPSSNEGGVG